MRRTCAAALIALMTLSGTGLPAAARPVHQQMQPLNYMAGQNGAQSDGRLYEIRDRRNNRNNTYGRPGNNRDAFRDRSYWDRRHGRGYYNRNYGGYRRDNSSAIAAGFLGLVLGAAIAGSSNDRDYARSRMSDRQWIASCERRYRSFDRSSGTYLGYDGYRHYCR